MTQASARRRWMPGDIRALGVSTDLRTAADIFGLGHATSYRLAAADEFPVPVIRVRGRYIVPTAPMLKALGLEDDDPTDPDASEGPGPDQDAA